MTMVFIQSQTVGNNSTGSITFSSIPQTFAHLQLRCFHAGYLPSTSANDALYIGGVNGNGLSYWHTLQGDGSSASSTGASTNIAIGIHYTTPTPTSFSNTIIDLLDYTNANKNKTFRSVSGFDRNGAGTVGVWSALYSFNTNAVSSLVFLSGGSFFASGTRIDLYGITTSAVTGA